MIDVMRKESEKVDLVALMTKFIGETIGREIEKSTQGIYPLQNVFIRKVKTLKAPKTDMTKLMELHGGAEAVADMGKVIERGPSPAPVVAEEADVADE